MLRPRRAFTLIELLVVVSIIALLIAILVPSLGKAKEMANRVYCAANLRGMTSGMITYATDNTEQFPVVFSHPKHAWWYRINWDTFAPDRELAGPVPPDRWQDLLAADGAVRTFYHDGNQAGCVPANLWVCVLQNRFPAKMLLCKSDELVISTAPLSRPLPGDPETMIFASNVSSSSEISYSIVHPWARGGETAPWWHNNLNSHDPLMSDMAPLSGDSAKQTDAPPGVAPRITNTANHLGEGQNVSFGDAHVEWARNPYVGPHNDNIFTVADSSQPITGKALEKRLRLPEPGLLGEYDSGYFDAVMTPIRKTSNGELIPQSGDPDYEAEQ